MYFFQSTVMSNCKSGLRTHSDKLGVIYCSAQLMNQSPGIRSCSPNFIMLMKLWIPSIVLWQTHTHTHKITLCLGWGQVRTPCFRLRSFLYARSVVLSTFFFSYHCRPDSCKTWKHISIHSSLQSPRKRVSHLHSQPPPEGMPGAYSQL